MRTDEHGQSESMLLVILPIERFDTRLAVQIARGVTSQTNKSRIDD